MTFPLESVACAETVLPRSPADCITEKFDWNDANASLSSVVACTLENCASCATDCVSSIGWSGSWFCNCVVSSLRKASCPSCEPSDDACCAAVWVLEIKPSIGRPVVDPVTLDIRCFLV